MRPQGYPARLRLKRRRDFLRVQRGGTKVHVRHFLIFVAPREPEAGPPGGEPEALPTRLRITVTRKIGNAVVRNRIKRLVREVFRRHRARVPGGLDMVWVAKQQSEALELADVLGDFDSLVRGLARGQTSRGSGGKSDPGKRGGHR